MDITRMFSGILFLVVGIALFRWSVVVRLRLEDEVKGGRKVVLNNYLPFWNADDFSEKGNALRKKYNYIYYALIVYSLLLFVFMKQG
jgi:hypothetical protein